MEKPLFVLAHPDDELLHLHAILSHEAPEVLIATNGEASAVNHREDDFVRNGLRREETLRALGALNIAEDQIHFGELPDGDLDRHISYLTGKIARIAIERGVDAIFSFDADGYDEHPDHITTYRASRLAATALSGTFGLGQVGHVVRSRSSGLDVVTYSGAEADKFTALSHHTSQFNVKDPVAIQAFKDDYAGGFTEEYYRQAA